MSKNIFGKINEHNKKYADNKDNDDATSNS